MQPHKAASRRHFETESKRRTQHAPFRNHVSDSLYQGQLESLHDSITRLQESNSDLDYSNRAFEILKKAKSNSNFIVKDLVWFVGSKKGAPDDETVFRFFNLLFTFASLVERFISDSTQEESTLEASEISMQIWNDITRVISLSRKNHNDRKYTSRKTTSLKLSCGDVHDHYCVIMKSFLSSLKVIETQKNIPGYNYGDMTMKKMISLSKCLVEFVSAFGSNLDSVEHIEVLIRDVLLVVLELDTNIYNQSMTNHILQLQTGVMECIIRILKWKHHSTRILITNTPCARMNGNMQLEINPLRDRLLKCINRTLNSDVYHQDEHYPFLRNTCQCLTKLLENIYNLDTAVQKHEHSKTGQLSTQIEVSYVFKWIHLVLQSDKPSHDFDGLSLKYCSLELLHVVIGLYPMSCAQFWALFLPQTRLQSKTSTSTTHYPKCTHHNVDLISLIDSIPGCMATSDEKVLAMDCCRQLIITLPLNLWSSTGYMNSRLEIALGELIRVTLKNLSNPIPMKQLQSSYALAETIIKCIPYDNYESLIRPAVHLISMIGQNYTKYGLHGGTGMIENVRTLTECLGGKETPSGNSTLLPLPSKIWLEGNDSTAFLDRLYNKISEIASYESIEKGMEATLQMELFIRMVKIIPNLRKDVKMDTFTNMAVKLLSSDDDTLQLTGSKLVRAYVEGRKVSISDEQSIPISVGIHLRSLLHFSDDVKCCVLSAYGSLRFCDWRVLLFEHCNPLQVILSACIECNEPNEKVRGEACKAIGNMISVCIKESNSELVDTMLRAVLEDVIDSILHVTTIAVHDSDANVRSMALFAIGNIALDLSESRNELLVPKLPLIQLCDTTYQRLFDDGEKVISNAIRTGGHLFHLLCVHENEFNLSENLTWLHLCGDFAVELAKKIKQAIADVLDSSESRSWKQRSGAKKHAWGACQALKHILLSSAAKEPVNSDGIHLATDSLISCVFYAEKLNEKIVNGAVSTLKDIPQSIWRLVSGKGLLGKCLVASIEKLQSFLLPAPTKIPLNEIVIHLLEAALDTDLMYFFRQCDRNQLDFIYKWMVDHYCQSDTFMTCAKALQSCHAHTFISIIQRFESRAIFESKKAHAHGVINNDDDGIMVYDDEEEDEL